MIIKIHERQDYCITMTKTSCSAPKATSILKHVRLPTELHFLSNFKDKHIYPLTTSTIKPDIMHQYWS